MRKLVPVFISTSILACLSTSAIALGDMNKVKKSDRPGMSGTQNTEAVGASGSASVSDSALTKGGSVSGQMSGDAAVTSGTDTIGGRPAAGSSLGAAGTASVSDSGLTKSGSAAGITSAAAAANSGTNAAGTSDEIKTNETIRDSAPPSTSRPDSAGGERSPGPLEASTSSGNSGSGK